MEGRGVSRGTLKWHPEIEVWQAKYSEHLSFSLAKCGKFVNLKFPKRVAGWRMLRMGGARAFFILENLVYVLFKTANVFC